MDKKAIILTGSILLLVGAAIGTTVYFVRKNSNNKDTNNTGSDTNAGLTKEELKKEVEKMIKEGGVVGSVDPSEYSSTNLIPGDKILKIGAEGRKVAFLQAVLNHYKGAKLKIDGVFGNLTRFVLLKNGFPMCAVAYTCEVTDSELLTLATKTKKDKSFAKQYNTKTNLEMKAVYTKYSS